MKKIISKIVVLLIFVSYFTCKTTEQGFMDEEQSKGEFESPHRIPYAIRRTFLRQGLQTQRPAEELLNADFKRRIREVFTRSSIQFSGQVFSCLSDSEVKMLNNRWTEQKLKKLLTEIFEEDQESPNSLSRQTLRCLSKSNDINTLLNKYNLVLQDLTTLNLDSTVSSKISLKPNGFADQIIGILSQIAQQINGEITKRESENTRLPADQEWIKTAANPHLMPEYHGALISSGILSTQTVSFPPAQTSQTSISGTYLKQGKGNVNNLISTFKAADIEVSINGRPYLGFSNFFQSLNLKKGQIQSSYSVRDASVSLTKKALRSSPNVFLTRVNVTSHVSDANIDLKNFHTAPKDHRIVNKTYERIYQRMMCSRALLQEDSSEEESSQIPRSQSEKRNASHDTPLEATTNLEVVKCTQFKVDKQSMPYRNSMDEDHFDIDSNMHFQYISGIVLPKGETFRFSAISAIVSSQQSEDPFNEALRLIIKVASSDLSQIQNEHNMQWQRLWRKDIQIKARKQNNDQQNVRIMLYSLYSLTNSQSQVGTGLGVKGLISEGHAMWLFPVALALHPQIAKELIEVRFAQLQSAKDNAFFNGYEGAMFSRSSSLSGTDQTPYMSMREEYQQYITGTIALNAWNYYVVTENKLWLQKRGYPLIEAAANFWQSRVVRKNQQYHIEQVIGTSAKSDVLVNDDAYTNAVAIQTFSAAKKAQEILGKTINKRWADIGEQLEIKISKGIILEHSAYSGEIIDSVNVNLLFFPLKLKTSKALSRKNLQYYSEKTSQNASAATWATYSLLSSRLGYPKRAYDFYKKSTKNMRGPFNFLVDEENPDVFVDLESSAAVLHSVIYGFGGMDLTKYGLYDIRTSIPKEWRKITVKGTIETSNSRLPWRISNLREEDSNREIDEQRSESDETESQILLEDQ